MNGSQFWELYNTYGQVYLNEDVENFEIEEYTTDELCEDYDPYDIVLEYILNEGYCDTVEDAEVLMAHMSEDWIDSILDEDYDSTVAQYKSLISAAIKRGDTKTAQKYQQILDKIMAQYRGAGLG